MLPRIRVIGSLNVDFTTITPRFPEPGETVTAKSLTVNAGGKGANQAVACGRAAFVSKSRQDVEVEMVGAVGFGDPYYTTLLKPLLEESGIDCSGIREVQGCQTGTAVVIVDEGSNGENRILVVPGANHDGMSDLPEVLGRAMKQPPPDVVVLQGEIPKHVVLAIITTLKKASTSTHIVFNPAPVFPDGVPSDVLHGISVLIVNEKELLLVGLSLEDHDAGRPDLQNPSSGIHNIGRLTRKIHDVGVQVVIVTLGSKGAYYSNVTGAHELVAGIEVKEVKDTTAAGDTFVGFFANCLAKYTASSGTLAGFDLRDAVVNANKAAAICVQRYKATESIPYLYEVNGETEPWLPASQ